MATQQKGNSTANKMGTKNHLPGQKTIGLGTNELNLGANRLDAKEASSLRRFGLL